MPHRLGLRLRRQRAERRLRHHRHRPHLRACGVLPASLVYVQQQRHLSDERVLRGLAVAGLIGNLIKRNASISGAECGCQAEIGTACAMAAAALTYLFGLKTDQIQYAAEIALEHHLGLTCDPICGLVQVPCIERNAVAAMRAMNSCNLAYFLSDTQRISFDMVVKTMYETGINLNQRFRETSEGGLAKMFKPPPPRIVIYNSIKPGSAGNPVFCAMGVRCTCGRLIAAPTDTAEIWRAPCRGRSLIDPSAKRPDGRRAARRSAPTSAAAKTAEGCGEGVDAASASRVAQVKSPPASQRR